MVVSMALIGLIRDRRLRFKLYERAAKIAHIIILGSVTAHITYHNTRYRPKGSGFCVSNHTSPMDMSVLSADCILTLVRTMRGVQLGFFFKFWLSGKHDFVSFFWLTRLKKNTCCI
jgi:1-acyl-sn-glycerol-3-phosphate acyltransferase